MANKTVEVKLKLTGDASGGSKALQEIQKQAQRTDKAAREIEEIANRRNFNSHAGRGGAGQNLGAGGFSRLGGSGPAGLQAGLTDLTSKLGMAVMAVQMFATALKESGGIARKSYAQLTPRTTYEKLEDLPLVGGILTDIKKGSTNLVYSKTLGQQDQDARIYGFAQRERAAYSPLIAQRDQANFNARAVEARRRVGYSAGSPDREGIVSQYGWRFEDQFAGLDSNLRQANLNKGRARATYNVAEMDVQEAMSDRNVYRQQVQSYAGKSMPEYNELVSKLQESEKRLQEAMDRRAQSEQEMLQANKEAKDASRELLAAQRDRAKSLYLEARQGAVGFSAMNPAEQFDVYKSLKQMNEGGYNSLSPRQKQMLQGNGLTQQYTQDAAYEANKSNPLINGILAMQGKKSLADMESEVKELTARLDIQISLDAEELSRAMDQALKANGLVLAKIVQEQIAMIGQQMQLNAQHQRTMERAGAN